LLWTPDGNPESSDALMRRIDAWLNAL